MIGGSRCTPYDDPPGAGRGRSPAIEASALVGVRHELAQKLERILAERNNLFHSAIARSCRVR